MNEKTKAFIEAVSKTITSEKLFREVITPAQNTFTPSKDIELDREAAQKAIGEALSLLPNAHTAIIWVTNGAECALVDTVAFPNSGDESTCFVAGYATRSDVSAEFFAKRLADYGAFENVDEDTETDLFEVDETEGEKKPHLFEAVKAAGSKGITLSADNIGDFDFSGLEFWTPEAELSLAKSISECLNAPNVVESIKNGTTTTEEAVKDIIATFKETHEGNLIYKFAADAEAKPKATPKAE